MIGWKIFSPMVGILSGIILSMLPFSLGLSQLVTVESFKIFIYPLTIYVYLQLIEKFSWKKVLIAGIITGIALQVKQSNFLLIPMLYLMFLFQYRKSKVKEKIGFINTRVKVFFLILSISILTFILIWPQVLFHFKEVYVIHQKFWNVQFSPKIWQITLSPPEIFFGRLMLTPIFYYVYISLSQFLFLFYFCFSQA
jgi:4-amino-4-deoxy-L-arabinose transferase-like glycosyltransferase